VANLPPPLTLLLLVLTVATSIAGWKSRGAVGDFAECPYEIMRHGRWYQLITSAFLHADLGHLFLNMMTLYFFGPLVEHALPGWRYLALYLGSTLAGSVWTLLAHHREPNYRALGASGAISGVVFSFVLFQPLAKIYIFLIPIGIPAFLYAIAYVLFSIFGMRRQLGRIGHEAHLGGALGGLLLTLLLRPDSLGIFLSHFQ
jgi:membrane associated rhomboid family serine protease